MFPRHFRQPLIAVSVAFSIIIAMSRAQNSLARPVTVTRTAINAAMKQLAAPTVQARVTALKQLAAYGPAAAKAVPAIVDALNENRTAAAGFAFGKPVSPAITDAALLALKAIGKQANDAAPYVTPLLKDRNELFRRTQVLQTLNAIGPSSDSAEAVIRVVREEGKFTETRLLAITLLGKIDPPAVEATDLLRDICEDATDKKAQSEANKVLDSILRRASATPAKTAAASEEQLLRSLRLELDANKSPEARQAAMEKIAELGTKASALVPTLMQIINDRDPSIKHASLEALGAIGKDATVAVPSLVLKFLTERDQDERGYISRAVAKIDPAGKRTLPLLQEPLEDPFKAKLAIEMLQEFGTDETTTLAQKARQRWRVK